MIQPQIPFDNPEKLQNYFLDETIKSQKNCVRKAFFGNKVGLSLVHLLQKCKILQVKAIREKVIGISKEQLAELINRARLQNSNNTEAIDGAYQSLQKKWEVKSLEVKISPQFLESIKENRPRLHDFLTNPNFKYDAEEDYDLGIEDEFRVQHLDPQNPEDKKFLESLDTMYPQEMKKIRENYLQALPVEYVMKNGEAIKKEYPEPFTVKNETTLKDSDIATMLRGSVNDEKTFHVVKLIIRYCITR